MPEQHTIVSPEELEAIERVADFMASPPPGSLAATAFPVVPLVRRKPSKLKTNRAERKAKAKAAKAARKKRVRK